MEELLVTNLLVRKMGMEEHFTAISLYLTQCDYLTGGSKPSVWRPYRKVQGFTGTGSLGDVRRAPPKSPI